MGRIRMTDEEWESKERARAEREAASLLACGGTEEQRKAVAQLYAHRRLVRANARRTRVQQWRMIDASRDLLVPAGSADDIDQSPFWRAYWKARPEAHARYLAAKYADLV